MRRLVLLSILAVASCSIAGPALAQGNCQPFSALMQASIILDPNSLPPAVVQPDFGWGGVVFGLVGTSNSYLGGWFYGKDDKTGVSTYHKANGKGRNGVYKFAFGTKAENGDFLITDSFDLQLGQAVWTVDPSSIAYTGNYKASGELANGTGIFAGARGNFTLHGDFSVWVVDDGLVSVWNPNLEGTVCH
jgi:hypothetical protein